MSITIATHNCQIHRLLLKLKDTMKEMGISKMGFSFVAGTVCGVYIAKNCATPNFMKVAYSTFLADEEMEQRILDDPSELEIHLQSKLPSESGIPDDAPELKIHPQSGLPPMSGIAKDAPKNSAATEQWMLRLHAELKKQGITLPERINDDELRRFYFAAGGCFVIFLYYIKRTIRWRQSSYLLMPEELEVWSDFVFWHWHDVKRRPCLIIRLGLACSQLTSNQKAGIAQAIVSQVEYGVLHLLDKKNSQISVLLDCKELSPHNIPHNKMLSMAILLLHHYPTRLGCMYVLRLPPFNRVFYQTIFQVLRVPKEELMFVGENHCEVLSEYFQIIPSFLGGHCSCPKCSTVSQVQDTNN